MIDNRAPVVVIYRGGQGALAIARTLGRLGVPVHLVAHASMPTPVWSSRYWVERHRWDFDRSEEESLTFLLQLGATLRERHGAAPLLLTLADWVAVFIERHAARLAEQFVFPRPRHPVLERLLNKWGMHELANEGGIPTPVTVCPATTQAALRFASEAGYPVVMKAANPFVPARPPTALVRDQDQLLQHLTRLGAHGQPLNIVLQEHIPGAVDCVWMCNGYFGADPARSVTFTGTKLRQVSPTGVASLAVCRPNDTVARQTRDFLHRIGYRGCVGIGWRYDARDGRYKLLDVNARVSGVFRLFAGTNEMDVVRICYLDLTGQPIPPTSLQPGRKWMLEDDVLAAAGAIRNGSLTIRGWTASMRGVRELHWLAADDPRPFLGWARGRAARAAQEAGARFGPRSDVRS